MARTRRPKTTRDEWGSITRLPDGRWRLRYHGPDGKRRDGGRFATRIDAEQARAQLRTSILGGSWRRDDAAHSPLLTDYAATWLRRAEQAGQLAPSTVALYRRLLDRLVLPDVGGAELGRVPVARLTRAMVLAWELAANATAREQAAAHDQARTGGTALRREGHPARAWGPGHRGDGPAYRPPPRGSAAGMAGRRLTDVDADDDKPRQRCAPVRTGPDGVVVGVHGGGRGRLPGAAPGADPSGNQGETPPGAVTPDVADRERRRAAEPRRPSARAVRPGRLGDRLRRPARRRNVRPRGAAPPVRVIRGGQPCAHRAEPGRAAPPACHPRTAQERRRNAGSRSPRTNRPSSCRARQGPCQPT